MTADRSVITVTVPMPSSDLTPNARVHWRKLSRTKRAYKRKVAVCALEALGGGFQPWPACIAVPVFFFETNRNRDRDNWGAALKYAYDEIVRAGLLTDDANLAPDVARLRVDPANPRVEITFQRVDDPAELESRLDQMRGAVVRD